jgi:hypothetical protein
MKVYKERHRTLLEAFYPSLNSFSINNFQKPYSVPIQYLAQFNLPTSNMQLTPLIALALAGTISLVSADNCRKDINYCGYNLLIKGMIDINFLHTSITVAQSANTSPRQQATTTTRSPTPSTAPAKPSTTTPSTTRCLAALAAKTETFLLLERVETTSAAMVELGRVTLATE